MASRNSDIKACPSCGATLKVHYESGVDPIRSTEIGKCPMCDAEIVRKNITGSIEMELIK